MKAQMYVNYFFRTVVYWSDKHGKIYLNIVLFVVLKA